MYRYLFGIFVLLIIVQSHCNAEVQSSKATSFAQPSPSAHFQSQIDSLSKIVQNLQKDVERQQIARDYFTTIIASQTAIFSAVVLAALGLTWIFSWFRIKSIVNSKTEVAQRQLRVQLLSLNKKNIELIETKFKDSYEAILNVDADIARAFANMHSEQPTVSYIWWLRAATKYSVDNEKLIFLALSESLSQLKKIQKRHEIALEMSEITTLIAQLDQTKYTTPISAINKEIERIYAVE